MTETTVCNHICPMARRFAATRGLATGSAPIAALNIAAFTMGIMQTLATEDAELETSIAAG